MATKAVLSEAEVGVLVKDIYGKVYKINCNLTVTVRAGSRMPKSSKMLITAEMSMIAQK